MYTKWDFVFASAVVKLWKWKQLVELCRDWILNNIRKRAVDGGFREGYAATVVVVAAAVYQSVVFDTSCKWIKASQDFR